MPEQPRIQQSPPKYLQIAGHIRSRIASGELGPGDPVPSEREIVASFGVSRPTATRALGTLRAQGQVVSRQGLGTIVSGRAAEVSEPLVRVFRRLLSEPGRVGWYRHGSGGHLSIDVELDLTAEEYRAVAQMAIEVGRTPGTQH